MEGWFHRSAVLIRDISSSFRGSGVIGSSSFTSISSSLNTNDLLVIGSFKWSKTTSIVNGVVSKEKWVVPLFFPKSFNSEKQNVALLDP